MSAVENIDAKAARVRRPRPEMVIEYLRYAVADVRALSPQSTKLLEEAIAILIDETSTKDENVRELR